MEKRPRRIVWPARGAVVLGAAALALGIVVLPVGTIVSVRLVWHGVLALARTVFVSTWIAGACGVVLAGLALARVRSSGDEQREKKRARFGMILSILGIVGGTLLFTAGAAVRRNVLAGDCSANLRQLGIALSLYSMDNGEILPPDLQTAEQYLLYVDVRSMNPYYAFNAMVCPADRSPIRYPSGFRTSYRYVGSLPAPAVWQPGEVIVAYEHAKIHRGIRGVTCLDGHAEFVPEKELDAKLQESLASLRESVWDELSPERRREIEAFYTEQ